MPRDRKVYNKDMRKHKIAFRSISEVFKPQKSLFHGKPAQQEPVLSPILTEQKTQ